MEFWDADDWSPVTQLETTYLNLFCFSTTYSYKGVG